MSTREQLKEWFANFKKPTQNHFWAWLDSFWHKSDKIPLDSIEGLDTALQDSAPNAQFQAHLTDTQAHKALFDVKLDKGGYTGTAQELHKAIEAINTLLASDDTDLDQLQEIVTYIKQNKQILSQLSIDNIAGLKEALSQKVNVEAGKGLSSNDFTDTLKQKLEGLKAEGAGGTSKDIFIDTVGEVQLKAEWAGKILHIGSGGATVLDLSLLPAFSSLGIIKVVDNTNITFKENVSLVFPNTFRDITTSIGSTATVTVTEVAGAKKFIVHTNNI